MPDSGSLRLLKSRWHSIGSPAQVGLLLLLSALFVVLLELAGIPAALLLGPMAAAIVLAGCGGAVRVPPLPFLMAQGLVGSMMGRTITNAILVEATHEWPIFLAGVVSVIVAATLLGFLLAKSRVLPGATAIWGSSPGAATVMTFMAEAYGADVRLVACMQYVRVVLVATIASLLARFWTTGPTVSGAIGGAGWFPPVAWGSFGETVALVALAATIGVRLRLPAGALVLPLFASAALQDTGLVTIELPPWLLAVSYALIGWNIGLRFTRPILVYAARTLPVLMLSTLILIAICGGFAWILARVTGLDALSAYLAMSPGGADSVAIIAASAKVNMPFVMALQTARFLVVLVTGPRIAQFITARLDKAGR
jgi:membrane AbrB-like protein